MMQQAIRGCAVAVFAILCTTGMCAAADRDAVAVALTLPSPNALPLGDTQWPAFQTYRVHVRYAGRRTIDLTFNKRDWFYAVARDGPDVVRTYFVPSVAYNSFDGRPWEKIDYGRLAEAVPPRSGASNSGRPRRATPATVSRWLSEQIVDGRRYRAFGTYTGNAETSTRTLVETCLVDEQTRRMRSCRRPGMYSAVFDHYDDPHNDFTVPASVRRARDVTQSLLSRR